MVLLSYTAAIPLHFPVIIGSVVCCVILTVFALLAYRQQRTLFLKVWELRQEELAALMEEQRRIAAGMHDFVCSKLAVVLVQLEQIGQKVPGHQAITGEMAAQIKESIARIKQVVQNMDDEKIITRGLQQSLQLLMLQYEHITDASPVIGFSYEVQRPLSPFIVSHIYQMVQELLRNVLTHANATVVTLRIKQQRKILYLYYSDDGCGLPPKINPEGQGLKNLHYRVNKLGGRLKIKSQKGLSCLISIPLIS